MSPPGSLSRPNMAAAPHRPAAARPSAGTAPAPRVRGPAPPPRGRHLRPPTPPAATAATAAPANGALSDADVDRIARRVVELLGERLVREVAWEVIPDMAELVIKDRIRELERQLEGP